MRNLRLTIEYDGTGYNGWQAQAANQKKKGGRVKTIQAVLGDALFRLFSKRVKLISSGRTDSGVHAEAQVAHFKVHTELKPPRIKKALNTFLPADIRIKMVEVVNPDFNAQHDALNKTYRYAICNKDYVSPFARRYVYHFTYPLNISLMRKEAKVLLGTHDFSAFKSSAGEITNCKRTIKRLKIRKKKDFIEIEIEADGFLYNMVRNIVGTLLEIGRDKFPPGSARKILKSKDRRKAGPTVPAKGLCLINVKYGR
jgi:tRNA pseudouridine38-40 synthase